MAETITKMDREATKAVTLAAREALEEVAARFGLTVKVGGGSYDPQSGTMKPKVEFAMADSERLKFETEAPLLWLTEFINEDDGCVIVPSDYGAIVPSGRGTQQLRLVGVNLRAPKYPFLFEVVGSDNRVKGGASFARKIMAARGAK